MYVNYNKFYREVITGEKPVKEIFSSLSSLSPNEYDNLHNEFSNTLEQNFESYEDNHIINPRIRKYKMPPKLYTRVRLAIILLSVCALGATFDDNVYGYTLDFVLKRELCHIPISLN